ncbi:uncharacterized protein [Phyllobates terribilis]|uniref:uncharacterized protein n=1 Tax=Phyllobates terribilis TaxID=111132 RepID=UPI003CCAA537
MAVHQENSTYIIGSENTSKLSQAISSIICEQSTMVPPVLSVRHSKPKLVVPCKPTPGGKKQLSHIDQQGYLRSQMPMLLFYPAGKETNSNVGRVIKEALGKALVYYYPWAGRMMESDDGNLVVDCTGEGVLFVEAEADITLAEMAGNKGFLAPPFPCVDDLLYDVPEAFDIIDSPLLLFQVTRLACGGFVLGFRMNHTMTDGVGIIQFLNAIAEIARGASRPSVMPVWRRHILCFLDLPCVISTDLLESESNLTQLTIDPNEDEDDNNDKRGINIHRTFFFGHDELSIIRQRLQPCMRSTCTTFELLAAFLWRSRIIALRLHSLQHPTSQEYITREHGKVQPVRTLMLAFVSHTLIRLYRFTRIQVWLFDSVNVINGRVSGELFEYVSLMFVVNVRPRFDLPDGYYGNAIILAAAVSQAGKVTSSLDHAVELVKRGKEKVTMEFIRSVSLRPGPAPANFQFTDANSWVISDNKPFKFLDIDFGWGKPVYGGPASDLVDEQPIPVSYFINGMDDKGRSGLLVPVCLPDASMDRCEIYTT